MNYSQEGNPMSQYKVLLTKLYGSHKAFYFCQYILKEVTCTDSIKQSTDAAFSRSNSHNFAF